jgi:tetraacyldisaccharide 4'-kinase
MNRAATIGLTPFSVIYGGFIRAGNALYRRGTFKTHSVGAPVISVGNLTTGGTGKTPLVEYIAGELAKAGRRVCVLTRGYRRESSGRVQVSDGLSLFADVNQAGDEAFQLAEKLRGRAAVVCDADRVAAARWSIENLNSDAFVLDDGFQHQRIARDLNILAIDATNPWGNGRLLPAGILRERRSALSRADCVVITRADNPDQVAELRKEIETLQPGMSIFTSRMLLRGLRPLDESQSTPNVAQRPTAAFCAIGNPDSFFNLLRRNDYELNYTRGFRDHHKYTQSDIDDIARNAQARGAQALITTAKDAVKLRTLRFAVPSYVAEIAIELDAPDQFRELLSQAIHSH